MGRNPKMRATSNENQSEDEFYKVNNLHEQRISNIKTKDPSFKLKLKDKSYIPI